MDCENCFWRKQHFLTTRERRSNSGRRRLIFNGKQVNKLVKKQDPGSDLFITKYPLDRIISVIILDFDSEGDKSRAYVDARRLRNYLKIKGLNTVIVSSGFKGYHTYTQIPPTKFSDGEFMELVGGDYDTYFNFYVKELIKNDTNEYKTLDLVNLEAGLGGNIRLIGSIHPSTGEKCEIIKGTFKDFQEPNHYHLDCLKLAHRIYNKKQKTNEKKKNKFKNSKKYKTDMIKDNDLRSLMPRLFSSDYKTYSKGYIYMNCPFHDDIHPSLLVTREWYSCSACAEKGNIFTLQKKGYNIK